MRSTLGRTSALRHEMPARYDAPHAGGGQGRAFIHSISLRAPCSGRACGGAGRCIKGASVCTCMPCAPPPWKQQVPCSTIPKCNVQLMYKTAAARATGSTQAAGPAQSHTSSLAVAQTPQPDVTLPLARYRLSSYQRRPWSTKQRVEAFTEWGCAPQHPGWSAGCSCSAGTQEAQEESAACTFSYKIYEPSSPNSQREC